MRSLEATRDLENRVYDSASELVLAAQRCGHARALASADGYRSGRKMRIATDRQHPARSPSWWNHHEPKGARMSLQIAQKDAEVVSVDFDRSSEPRTAPETQRQIDRIHRFDSVFMRWMAWAAILLVALTVAMAILAGVT
jgi:hypothetical protein